VAWWWVVFVAQRMDVDAHARQHQRDQRDRERERERNVSANGNNSVALARQRGAQVSQRPFKNARLVQPLLRPGLDQPRKHALGDRDFKMRGGGRCV
jgi:hypothetical protein